MEVAVLAFLTVLYLTVTPHRPLGVDIGLALVGLALIGFSAKNTREHIWGPPAAPKRERIWRCTRHMLLITLPVVLLFGAYAVLSAYLAHRHWRGVLAPLFRPTFFAALILFIPWALLQQMLFQFYLLGRLRALVPYVSPLFLSLVNGFLYGAVHLPDWDVALVTMPAGVAWSYSYHRDRSLLPISVSHAVLGTTYFYWVRNRDLVLTLFNMQ